MIKGNQPAATPDFWSVSYTTCFKETNQNKTEMLKKGDLNENYVFLKPRPYFLFKIRLSTHREQFGEDPLKAI